MACALWAIQGINGILNNAEEVIKGNALRTDLEHKYVQHLHWINNVNALITDDNITELNVQTDPYKCDFGKWYYGEGRKEAERLAPQLAPLLAKMEEPHKLLHESAIKIQDVFIQANYKTGAFLCEAKSDHLLWVNTVKNILLEGKKRNSLNVELDPNNCAFGLWLNSDETKELRSKHFDFNELCRNLEPHHAAIHENAVLVEEQLKKGLISKAKDTFVKLVEPETHTTLEYLDKMIKWNHDQLEGINKAQRIYHEETMAHIGKLEDLFDGTIEKSKYYILTDEAMFKEASSTRFGVIIFSILASIAAIITAFILTKGILKPVRDSVTFANAISKGNLTAAVSVEQEDEIGSMVKALKTMAVKLSEIVSNIKNGADNIATASQQLSSTSQEMSQGSNEQAASVQEISATMEEIAANIEQNTANAQQTEKISGEANSEISLVTERAIKTIDANKKIASKITIINDIAFQTNILALNAAVEAARAGENGKGFAVVASEVRKLAERSKIAADEIVNLAEESLELAQNAGAVMETALPKIKNTTNLIHEISASSTEQNNGAIQVNNAIQQLNGVTQQNAAASEELATNAEELSSQALLLKDIIAFFKTTENDISFLKKTQKLSEQETATITPLKSNIENAPGFEKDESANDTLFESY